MVVNDDNKAKAIKPIYVRVLANVHLIVYVRVRMCTVCYLATATDWICDKNAAWFI